MSSRAYYAASLTDFLNSSPEKIIGYLTANHSQDLVHQQTNAWQIQIEILQNQLQEFNEALICFELLIPRMGKRADVVLILSNIIFVIEFKVGEDQYKAQDLRQAQGYALDLSCFHEESHHRLIVPILLATDALENLKKIDAGELEVTSTQCANKNNLAKILSGCISQFPVQTSLDSQKWFAGTYKPTPTIIEAAQALYASHDVADISRSDAEAINISLTANRLNQIIHHARVNQQKTICFVTGVPGAGKTLVGLQIATSHNHPHDEEHAVFLSGNGPLVDVLREALARDKVKQSEDFSKSEARRETASFIQNIHHFRDEALKNKEKPPIEKVVIFDEAQRAWDQKKASAFMQRKRNQADFNQSEPDFLISVMDRHKDWCVIIALIGGGQEINDGEAGLNGWFSSLATKFSHWKIFYSEKISQKEYVSGNTSLAILQNNPSSEETCLHLAISLRSFRAEKVSHFVHYLIHNQPFEARAIYGSIAENFPIYVTRDLLKAKKWIQQKAKGLETYGLLASSGAKRLKADGIFVNDEIKAEEWFLNEADDVRSCRYLEDVATEFVVQGLELDWCLVAWDADFRYNNKKFEHLKFSGTKWMRIKQDEQQRYLENSYRVLLTRARQGMVIYIPLGNREDVTRNPEFYDQTFGYLIECGVKHLPSSTR